MHIIQMTTPKKSPCRITHMTPEQKKAYLMERDRIELMALIEEQADKASDKKDMSREEYYKTISKKQRDELERVRVLHLTHRGRLKGGRDKVQEDNLPISQFERIVLRFGSISNMFRCVQAHRPGSVSIATIYNWRNNSESERGRGSGGVIPHKYAKVISDAARMEGIFISTEDFNPEPSVLRHK